MIAALGLLTGAVVAAARTPAKADTALATPSPTTRPSPSPSRSLAVIKPSPVPSVTPKSSPKPTSSPARPLTNQSQKRSFLWGATIQLFPFKENNSPFLPEQFRLAHELGLNVVRADYSLTDSAMNQLAIDQADKYNIALVFIIPFGPKDIFTDSNLSSDAYQYVHAIVAAHKGQVPVWQLATEPASVALIDGGHYGVDKVDYPDSKYVPVATWLKAASKAVHDADPAARRMINDQWTHVGFFDRFLADGGDFDILGWNWFSDMGTDMTNPVINTATGQHYALMQKLVSFHRDIWITESNRRGGSHDGNETAQANYIQTMAEKAYANPAIKAYLVFDLVEDQSAPSQEQGYGIVNVNLVTDWTASFKAAYGRYQNLIASKK